MGRAPCCEKVGLKKGPWTPQEDQKLIDYVKEHGHGSWRSLPKKAGLLRCGKSCRLRWANYLRPDIKRGEFSLSEEQLIIQLHGLLGNRWSSIATHLPKRTDNEIKNYWNTHLKKRLMKMGVDPVTHKPMPMPIGPIPMSVSLGSLSLSHEQQWESARIEGEARLAAASSLFLDKLPLSPEVGKFSKMPNLDLAVSDSQCSSPSSIIPELFSSSITTCNYDTSAIEPPLSCLPLEQDQIATLNSYCPLSSSSSNSSSNSSNNVDILASLVEMKEDKSLEDDFIIPEYCCLKTMEEDWATPLGHELTDFQLLQIIGEGEQCTLF